MMATNHSFTEFFAEIPPIKLKEPLAETLGAIAPGTFLEYSFSDAVKMAGHACPTVSGAFLACRRALNRLYPNDLPVRGDITITVYGDPDEGVYGVMAQVFSLITGAAPETGFHGLGHKFKRKNLLRFVASKPDPEALCFEFRRLDTNRAVMIKFFPQRVPFAPDKSQRMGELMEKVLWEAARSEEIAEFQHLWMQKVRSMVLEEKEIDTWLKIEERNN